MADIKYQYAYNESGTLVSINDLTKETSKLHTFRCVGCGNPLLPRAIGSTARRAHFYHREIVACSGETYVHKLAKKLLKERFDTSEEFLVSYSVTMECNNKDCRLRNIHCHKEYEKTTIDLKKYYNTCTEEVGIGGFIADLLLTNSKRPDIDPVLLEVCVTHACEDEKLASGMKIIELKVKKEQDVIEMVGREVFDELNCTSKKEKDVQFFSFKREVEGPLSSDVIRYIFNPLLCENGYVTTIDCKKADYKLLLDSVCELNMVNTENYTKPERWHALEWMSKNKNLRRCNLCKFYYATMYEDSAICRLSKKYGKPMYPKMTDAESCRSYHHQDGMSMMDMEMKDLYVEEVTTLPMSDKKVYRVIIAGSSLFDDRELFTTKCDYYLEQKMKSHNVVILSGTSMCTTQFINEYADNHSLLVEPHEADWNKYGKEAGIRSNEDMLNKADALIAFWDGKGWNTGALIRAARAKGIKVAEVRF